MSGQSTAIVLPPYRWVGGEYNSTAYFDKKHLMYTDRLLQCRMCTVRSAIFYRIRKEWDETVKAKNIVSLTQTDAAWFRSLRHSTDFLS